MTNSVRHEQFVNGLHDLIMRNREYALLVVGNAHEELAIRTFGLMINHLMTRPARKPYSGMHSGRKDDRAGSADIRCQVHRATIVADKRIGLFQNSGTYPR